MKIKNIFFICFTIVSVSNFQAIGQDRFESLKHHLDTVSLVMPGLNEPVELSLNGVSIQELVRTIASLNNVNIVVDQNINVKVSANFSSVTTSEVLVFLCKKYILDLDFTGSIVSIIPFNKDIGIKNPNISYSKETALINVDLNNDTLSVVMKYLASISGKNILFAPSLSNKIISGYIQNLPLNSGLDKLLAINELKLTLTNDSVYFIESIDQATPGANNKNERTIPRFQKASSSLNSIKLSDNNLISLDLSNVSIQDLIASLSTKLNFQYYFVSELKGICSISTKQSTLDEVLNLVLINTEFTFCKDNGVYLFGNRSDENLRHSHLLPLQYRTVDKVIEYIPENLKKAVEIKSFPDQNSLIVTGNDPNVNSVKEFINSIDKVVPVIAIEVMIVDVRDSKTLSTGIEAGIGDKPLTTSGTVFPNFNMNLGSTSINDIVTGINGLGAINIGKVTPNFYLKLKALDQQGVLKLRSTPKLATLNGHEATLSIGKTEYYLETSNNVIGTQNPQNIITQTYKSVNADLAVKINPIVSGDEQITLDIDVKQSSFTERISPSAPPGTITRDFKSLIRVKNEDMIILGGLEENSIDDSGSGVPFLSRIPIIKWFFSSRDFNKSKNRLTIFIKSTVMY